MHTTEKASHGLGIFTLSSFLSPEECIRYIEESERAGYEEAEIQTRNGPVVFKGIRNNDRVIFDDWALADTLFQRAKTFLPEQIDDWNIAGLNECFRFYRYTSGQYFKWHKDGFFCRNETEESRLSFLIYLNDDYEGGEIDFRWDALKPAKGMAVVFPHLLMHQGSPVESGVKYVLRTDVMYCKNNISTSIKF